MVYRVIWGSYRGYIGNIGILYDEVKTISAYKVFMQSAEAQPHFERSSYGSPKT